MINLENLIEKKIEKKTKKVKEGNFHITIQYLVDQILDLKVKNTNQKVKEVDLDLIEKKVDQDLTEKVVNQSNIVNEADLDLISKNRGPDQEINL